MPELPAEIVVGMSHIPGIANDVDDFRIAGVKILMALDDAGPWCALQSAARLARSVGNEAFDVRKTHLGTWMHQIRDQKSCPGVARARKGDKEGIIGKNRKVAAGNVVPEKILQDEFDAVNHVFAICALRLRLSLI